MSEAAIHRELATDAVKSKSPLKSFAMKVGIIAVAALLVVRLTVSIVTGALVDRLDILKGGPEFWGMVEQKLYKLAEEPDLPPAKKEKIVKALAALSAKYQPYVEALNGRAPK